MLHEFSCCVAWGTEPQRGVPDGSLRVLSQCRRNGGRRALHMGSQRDKCPFSTDYSELHRADGQQHC